MNLQQKFTNQLESARTGLASGQADGVLAGLGLLSGLLAGAIIVAFRYAVDLLQLGFIGQGAPDSFEHLTPGMRFLLPVLGAVLLAVIYWRLQPASRTVGIVHVLERLHYHQGHMPLRNVLVQFFGGVMALASGHSVGREAPSVHLGAGAASLLGHKLMLPNNSIRTLVACGAAAAIAASFNTPLAGVVFAMEVIMMEYTIAGFVPVILAAVAATAITRAVFGADTALLVPLLGLASLWELFYITIMGVLIGTLSASFVAVTRWLVRIMRAIPLVTQFLLAGIVVGALGTFVPQIMGVGYDTASAAVAGHLGAFSMLVILVTKLTASAACAAARVPGGLIGPTIVMGCLAGGCFAHVVGALPGPSSPVGLYAMLGMGAMMGAALQAPLAALLALLELTGNPLVLMPAMLAVVSANLTAKIVFRQDSIFTLLLRDSGLDYRHDPLSQSLRRVGVAAAMNRSFEICARHIEPAQALLLLERGPQWIIVECGDERRLLVRASDLARYCENERSGQVDLVEFPAERLELAPIHLQASLFEAREAMQRAGVEALFVRRATAPLSYRTFGVLLKQEVESGYVFRA